MAYLGQHSSLLVPHEYMEYLHRALLHLVESSMKDLVMCNPFLFKQVSGLKNTEVPNLEQTPLNTQNS